MLRALVLLAVVIAATQAASVVKRHLQSVNTYAYLPVSNNPPSPYLGLYYSPPTYSSSYSQPLTYSSSYTQNTAWLLMCLTFPSYCWSGAQAPPPTTAVPTTAKPTTPTTTTTSTTTTTTTTTPTTTTPLKLCPPGTGARRKRQFDTKLLNGVTLNECNGDGIIGFQNVVSGTKIAACNGVVAPDPANPTSYVIYTDPVCVELLKVVRDDPNLSVDGTVYGTTIPNLDVALDLDNAVTTNGVTVVKPTILGKYFFANAQSTCESAACVYKASTMASYIDKTKCYVASYGVTTQSGVASPGGNRVDIKVGGTCANAPAGSECFTALKTTQSPCSSDTAAPVYCATKTGEEVLYGILPYSSTCDLNSPAFNVMPIKA